MAKSSSNRWNSTLTSDAVLGSETQEGIALGIASIACRKSSRTEAATLSAKDPGYQWRREDQSGRISLGGKAVQSQSPISQPELRLSDPGPADDGPAWSLSGRVPRSDLKWPSPCAGKSRTWQYADGEGIGERRVDNEGDDAAGASCFCASCFCFTFALRESRGRGQCGESDEHVLETFHLQDRGR